MGPACCDTGRTVRTVALRAVTGERDTGMWRATEHADRYVCTHAVHEHDVSDSGACHCDPIDACDVMFGGI